MSVLTEGKPTTFDINAAAAIRDYYVEPRCGIYYSFPNFIDYKTISSVNGPLVVLENVKVLLIIIL